jgi:hypothetical protein
LDPSAEGSSLHGAPVPSQPSRGRGKRRGGRGAEAESTAGKRIKPPLSFSVYEITTAEEQAAPVYKSGPDDASS